ncbi:hypothetical protein ACHAXA_003256 [Cyclostephanos tholiformis]|uniref:tRNA (guanine(46)-N(7))-methyltransferase n=1 Tax=Cyclostephanos tholiformis TaxID=382380 RepID=A0ABD3SBJ2_9STRA
MNAIIKIVIPSSPLILMLLSSNVILALAFVVEWHHPSSHRPATACASATSIARRAPTNSIRIVDESHPPSSFRRAAAAGGEGGEDENDARFDPLVISLPEEERERVDDLVAMRSAARWAGKYDVADELRVRIEGMRSFVTWDRILRAAVAEEETATLGGGGGGRIADGNGEGNPRDFIDDARRRRWRRGWEDDVNDVHHGLECKVVLYDAPRSKGGDSTWRLIPIGDPMLVFDEIPSSSDVDDSGDDDDDDVLRLAHIALGTSVHASENGMRVNVDRLDDLVRRASKRLNALRRRRALVSFLLPPSEVGPMTTTTTTMKTSTYGGAGELHGRKAADAALWFALSGVNDAKLYDDLVEISTSELRRFGMNPGCRPKDVLHIVERIAMAGIGGGKSRSSRDGAGELYRVAADCLEAKMMGKGGLGDSTRRSRNMHYDPADEAEDGGINYGYIISSLRNNTFGLHSDRSLLGLWRFSTRQRKQRAFFRDAARHFDGKYRESSSLNGAASSRSSSGGEDVSNIDEYDWASMFKDPSRPLVVDVGCGMGVSLLGLTSGSQVVQNYDELRINWGECNFIGVDLSRLAVGYAQCVRSRWGMEGCLTFVVDSAENCLTEIGESYPGVVAMVMLQFPTPYRFRDESDEGYSTSNDDDASSSAARRGYNSQLPERAASDDFMVTENLLSRVRAILSKEDGGRLLIQSNCEDVAVHMRNVATKRAGFSSVSVLHPVTSLDIATQRTRRWVDAGGERAIGTFWSAKPLLPLCGRTETEVACLIDGKPVHRCLLL